MRIRRLASRPARRAVVAAWLIGGLAGFLGSMPPTALAATQFQTEALNAILIDAGTGLILFEKAPDALIPPASMSKLMTLAVVFRELKAGRLKLTDEFEVSEHAWRTGGAPSGTSAMFAPIHSKVTVDELIQGMAVQSGNDACLIAAEGIAGSEAAFVEMMNDYAKEIGLTRSRFKNSTGLPAEGHLMTARELARLAKYLMETYPEYYHYFGQPTFEYRKHTFRNRNPLIFDEIGADGLKTGHTEAAGYGLVASAKQGDRRLIGVVAGLKSKKARAEDPREMLLWGFNNFKRYTLFGEGEQVSRAFVWGGEQRYVPLVGEGKMQILMPTSDDPHIAAEVAYDWPVKAPIKKGDRVGSLIITSNDMEARNEIPLYAGEDVPESGFAWRGLDSLFVLAFGWVPFLL